MARHGSSNRQIVNFYAARNIPNMSNAEKPTSGQGTKEKLLQIACRKFLEAGDKGLSMRNIAKEAGLTPMAIYRHFDNKEALQQELLMEAFRQFAQHLYPALDGATAKDRFHRTVDGYFDFAVQQPAYFELIFLSINPMNSLKAQDIIQKESLPSFRFLMARVKDCIDEGYFRPGNAWQMSVALLAQSTGFAALHLSRSFDWTEAEAREMQAITLNQILTGFVKEQSNQEG